MQLVVIHQCCVSLIHQVCRYLSSSKTYCLLYMHKRSHQRNDIIFYLYSRNVYEDSGGGTLGDRIRSKSSIVRSRRDVENVEIENTEEISLRKLILSQTNSQSNHPNSVRLNKRSLWASWHEPMEYKDTPNSRQNSTFN